MAGLTVQHSISTAVLRKKRILNVPRRAIEAAERVDESIFADYGCAVDLKSKAVVERGVVSGGAGPSGGGFRG